jgi:DNA repair exonuclease SbcCD ATPase subunit
MSVVALHLYEKLNDAPDDKARSKAIVEAFSELEERYPDLKETATKRDLSETELRLQKEIQATKLEIKTVEANLQKEIEGTRLEIKTVEANLQKGIEEIRLEIEKVRSEIRTVETNFAKIVHKQTLWIIGAVGSIIMSIRLLEWFLTHLPH